MRKVLEITFAGEDDLEVVLASGSSDALALVHERRPSAALVDVTLRTTDGYELCRQLKQAAPGMLVLILSSKQTPYDPSRGSACGADDHVDKPFDTQALIERVRTLLERAPVAAVENVPAYPTQGAIQPMPVLQPDPAPQPIESVPPAELEIIPESVPPEPMRAESEPAAPVRPPVSGRDAAILSAATVRPGDEAPVNGSGNGLAALGGRLSDLGLTSQGRSSTV
jgi:DNA-binding NarL/FixJ family response regulator